MSGDLRDAQRYLYIELLFVARFAFGGLMMYLADDPEMRELKVKGAAGGRTFIGPDGPPGGEWDREVVSFDGNLLVTQWIDPELAGRYATMVMVRCS